MDEAKWLNSYPRPQMERNSYLNLNGDWEYQICKDGKKGSYQGNIIVPYSPEAKNSGVNKKLLPDEELWYKRIVSLPEGFVSDKIFLNFGAVDQICEVYINGEYVDKHIGGYTPFSIDLSKYVHRNDFLLEVKVKDFTEKSELTRGKQSLKPGGIFYHAQSGIWQTVWMESTPFEYIENVKITPEVDKSCIDIIVFTTGKSKCLVTIDGENYEIEANKHISIPIKNPRYWEIEDPYLYDVQVTCNQDMVNTYFGYRKIEIKKVDGVPFIHLNGKPVFLNGILEQGYYKDGLYTPDSYETIYNDIKTIKELGFNTIRKHIKVEPALYYYYCDKMGMLVIQDMVNGGGKYNKVVIGAPLFLNLKLKDNMYSLFSRKNEMAKVIFEQEVRDTITSLYNFPSIVMWSIFNESWGQFDSERIYNMVTSLDTTRLIDPNSGWYDQKFGDLKSDHCYFKKYRYKIDSLERATLLSEYGGYSYGKDHKFSYGNYKDEESYLRKIRKTIDTEIIPNIGNGLCGSIYTQYNDVEDETNGIVDEDRNLKIQEYQNSFHI